MFEISVNVNDRVLNFSYSDSGKPATSDIYTTAVIFHGLAFNSGIFDRAVALAPSTGVRLIGVNRRDYADTTLFSAEELHIIANGDKEARAAFLRQRALEYATVLTGLIEECSIPAPSSDGKVGGIALMGWSLGNMASLGVISAINSYPAAIKDTLGKYVRRIIIHTAPAVALGIHHPRDIKIYYPNLDPNVPPEARGEAFMHWASGYFDNGYLSAKDVHQLATNVFPQNTTYTHMSSEDRASTVDERPMTRSENPMLQRFQEEFLEQTRGVLCDQTVKTLLPLLEVGLLYGDSVSWSIVYAAWEVERMAQEATVRTVKSCVLTGKNTFMFWDHPEETLEALVSMC